MREIVIVIPDLYLSPSPDGPGPSATDTRANAGDLADTHASARKRLLAAGIGASVRKPALAEIPPGATALGSMPGFEHAARYGTRRSLASEGGWRPWLARWLGRPDLASYAPAPIAAASLRTSSNTVATGASPNAPTHAAPPPPSAASPNAPTPAAPTPTSAASRAPQTVWLATPVHLIAGLTNLHFDRRGILRLSTEELVRFAADFNRTFGDTDLHLEPLANSEFLLRGPAAWAGVVTTEPVRALESELESSLPKGGSATALKRLGAELEMWLHSHPVNAARQRRGERSVSTLWLWGGGALESLKTCDAPPTDLAYGADAYLAGLWCLQGAPPRALPDRFGDLLSDPKAERAALAPEITPLLQTNPNWTVFEALVDLDRLYLSPALDALHARALESVVVVANDVEVRLRPGDRRKFWRRPRAGIRAIL